MDKRNHKNMGADKPENFSRGSGKDRVYLDFYRLKEAPFSITPDPEFLFFSNTHQSVIDKILYGIHNRMGFILLTGEVGTGKTTLCRSILDSLEGTAEMVYIINPSLTGRELILSILEDLGVDCSPDLSKKELIDSLNRFALSTAKTRPVVIIIDDAQTMPVDALEDLRLLSNLETDKEKLLQMVLVGQPELLEHISRPEIRQLQQRITINCRLDFLTPQEVGGYIARRLFIAGDKGQVRFTRKAKQLTAKVSNGIPRLINKVCDYALTSGYLANDFTIGHKHVKNAMLELGDLNFRKDPVKTRNVYQHMDVNRRWGLYAAFGSVMLIIIILSVFVFEFAGIGGKNKIESSLKPVAATMGNKKAFPVNLESTTSKNKVQSLKKNVLPSSKTAQKSLDNNLAGSFVEPPIDKNAFDKKTGMTSGLLSKTDLPENMETGSEPVVSVSPILRNHSSPADFGDKTADVLDSKASFIIQFGSYKSYNRTMAAFYQYKEKGFDVHWSRVDLGAKGIWYRLFAGRFKTKKESIQFKKENGLSKSIVVFTPWTVLIEESEAKDEIERTCSNLRDHRIDYYTLRTKAGSYRLLSGAFVTEKGAEKLAKSIVALGYNGKVVLR